MDEDLQSIKDYQKAILEELDNLNYGDEHGISVGEKVATKVVGFIGSWPFIIVQNIGLIIWVIVNHGGKQWDPYPFILLNLMLSFQAANASPLILMAQNLADRRDQRKSAAAYRSITSIEKMMGRMQSKISAYKTKNGSGNGKPPTG